MSIFQDGSYEMVLDIYERVTPLYTPRMEECTLFWGIKYSWGINTTENKDL
jgi:hypothetical protein